jgi:hypothetical protein
MFELIGLLIILGGGWIFAVLCIVVTLYFLASLFTMKIRF